MPHSLPSWRLTAALTAVLAIIALIPVLLPLSWAQAATPVSIDTITTSKTEARNGTDIDLSATWSVADNPDTPLQFTIDLPKELSGYATTFPMKSPDGEKMGTCVVTNSTVTCTADDEYVKAHPNNLRGSVTFSARIEEKDITTTTTKTYVVGGRNVDITVTPGNECEKDCDNLQQTAWKSGYRQKVTNATTDALRWTINIPSPAEGMKAGQKVAVSDTLGAHQEFEAIAVIGIHMIDGKKNRSIVAEWHKTDSSPYKWTVNGTAHDDAEFTVNDARTTANVTFTAKDGYAYELAYRTLPTDGGAQGTYDNSGTITINGQEYTFNRATLKYAKGSADINGDQTTPPVTPTTEPATTEPATTEPATTEPATTEPATCTPTTSASELPSTRTPADTPTCDTPNPPRHEDTPDAPKPSKTLPRTGSEAVGAAATGVLLLLAGAAAIRAARRNTTGS